MDCVEGVLKERQREPFVVAHRWAQADSSCNQSHVSLSSKSQTARGLIFGEDNPNEMWAKKKKNKRKEKSLCYKLP